MNKKLIYWVWLSRIENLETKYIKKILEKYNIEEITRLSLKQLLTIVPENQAKQILNKKYRLDINKYVEYMEKNNIKIIPIDDEKYPEKLKKIEDAPLWLYAKGNIDILNGFSLAIIGCRKSTKYGEMIAERLAYTLSKMNINIISGLAKGIDSKAHIGAIKAKEKTIAVLGSGIDIIYPEENKGLAKEIIKNEGVIISEYIIGTKPFKDNFPKRNRIISGLSDGIIVVEAKEKSGSLITVEYGLEQGKEIFAVPGNLSNKNSVGTNKLIQEGAKLILEVADILEEYEK